MYIQCFQAALVRDGNAVGNRTAREKGAGCGAGFEFFSQSQVELLLKHCNGGVIVIIFIGAQATVTGRRVHVIVPQNIESAAHLGEVGQAGALEIGRNGERHIHDRCRTRSQAIDGEHQFCHVTHGVPIGVRKQQAKRKIFPKLYILSSQVALVGDFDLKGERAARNKWARSDAGFQPLAQGQVKVLAADGYRGAVVIILSRAGTAIAGGRIGIADIGAGIATSHFGIVGQRSTLENRADGKGDLHRSRITR